MKEKKSEIKSFEDLKVWKSARELQRKVSILVKTFPKVEQFELTDQMIRSSRSVGRNIAEGYGRYHFQENTQFCRQSRGSLTELLNDFITAFDEGYINNEQLHMYREEITNCHKLLNGYIAYLQRAKEDSKTKEDHVNYEIDNPINE
ncbi:MAG: four helix bundle protein [Candidatus Halalkalibacterium sp. M3_1C_030]